MKKLFNILVISTLGFAACSDGNSYKVIGTVEGAADGDTVYIQEVVGRDLLKTDTAIIISGKFSFNGKQDSTVNRYITYAKGNNQYITDFFLENGNINVNLGPDSKVAGTPTNNTYQSFKDKMNTLQEEQNGIYESLQDTTLTVEQRDAKIADIDAKDAEMTDVISGTIKENITNPVGVHLLSQFNYIMDYEDIEPLLGQIPEQYQSNERLARLKEQVEKAKSTAIGQKFVNFSMENPEGKTVQLSDFIGKSKYTLVDFWASWCGPCRREMPNLVSAYKEYKDKGLQIVGVSLDRDETSWKDALKTLNMTWPQMSDLKFWNSEGAQLYAVRSIPYTVLIAQDGTIVAKGLHGKELQEKLAELLN
ncbi:MULTISPECIES: TlpA disulfide reductase family protein [unclassified Bacteroides]|jgi:peroxiredoxin|uniref:TlpA disulfide reductase family protein n=1 Tax=unclassified Bacteroides TaxID=2646097 RepID=UPI000E9BD5B8|nr:MULTISPECIES: TlpA disulfide reductase family protein [unclassified Bacteroides]RGN45767.1 AhpC/TSA family protein [Bacteroides sp. OM05-12]RHR73906.1 AhpC/TSA family protein [Bacteroides sp. AF16-49]